MGSHRDSVDTAESGGPDDDNIVVEIRVSTINILTKRFTCKRRNIWVHKENGKISNNCYIVVYFRRDFLVMSLNKIFISILEIMIHWTVRYRVFTYDAVVKINNSVLTAQRMFRRHFDIHRNQPAPGRTQHVVNMDTLDRNKR